MRNKILPQHHTWLFNNNMPETVFKMNLVILLQGTQTYFGIFWSYEITQNTAKNHTGNSDDTIQTMKW